MGAKQGGPRRRNKADEPAGLLPILRSASAVRHLNYNHLLYFWTVVREGGITRAAEALHLTPQTISGQLRVLEEQIGGQLFERVGRRLQPTELGRIVQRYADDIFSLGSELARVVRGAPPRGQMVLSVGVADEVPKLIAYRMLEPVVRMTPPARLVCIEGTLDRLLSELAVHRLDVVNVRAYSHLLGECDLAVFGAPALAKRYRTKFPRSLDQAPWLLPTPHSPARRALDQWFDSLDITPAIVGEFDDSALIKAFGEAGVGIFCAPDAISAEVRRQCRVQLIGRTADVRPRFYAISIERRIRHPAVAEITSQARSNLLAST
jgi:LysR family transcriptional activator of nhaA